MGGSGEVLRAMLCGRIKAELDKLVSAGMNGRVISERYGIDRWKVERVMAGAHVPTMEKALDILECLEVKFDLVEVR